MFCGSCYIFIFSPRFILSKSKGFTGGSFPFQMPPGYVLGVPLRVLRVFVVNVVIPHWMPVLSLTLSARTEGSETEGAESRFS